MRKFALNFFKLAFLRDYLRDHPFITRAASSKEGVRRTRHIGVRVIYGIYMCDASLAQETGVPKYLYFFRRVYRQEGVLAGSRSRHVLGREKDMANFNS